MNPKENISTQPSQLRNPEVEELSELLELHPCSTPFEYLTQVTGIKTNEKVMIPAFKEEHDMRDTILQTLSETSETGQSAVFEVTGQLGAGKTTTLTHIFELCQQEGRNIGIVTAEDALSLGRHITRETPDGPIPLVRNTTGPYEEDEYQNATAIQNLAQHYAIQNHDVVLIENPVITDFVQKEMQNGTMQVLPNLDRGTTAFRELINRSGDYADLSYLPITFGIIAGKMQYHSVQRRLQEEGVPGGSLLSTKFADKSQQAYLDRVQALRLLYPDIEEDLFINGAFGIHPYRILGIIASYSGIYIDYLQKSNPEHVSLYLNSGYSSSPIPDQKKAAIFDEFSVIKKLEREGSIDKVIPQSR